MAPPPPPPPPQRAPRRPSDELLDETKQALSRPTDDQWLRDSMSYAAKRWQLCPAEAADVSPFNLLWYLAHMKSRVGPTMFRNDSSLGGDVLRGVRKPRFRFG